MKKDDHKAVDEALFALFAKELRTHGYLLGYEGVPPMGSGEGELLPAVFKRESAFSRYVRYINGRSRREGAFTIRLYANDTDTASRRHAAATLWALADLAASGDLCDGDHGCDALSVLTPDTAPSRIRYEGVDNVWEMRFIYRL